MEKRHCLRLRRNLVFFRHHFCHLLRCRHLFGHRLQFRRLRHQQQRRPSTRYLVEQFKLVVFELQFFFLQQQFILFVQFVFFIE